MIDVSNLLQQQKPIGGNYFAHDAYVSGDFEIGLIENRAGARLIAFPRLLLEAMYTALEQETGQASGLVLYNCGRWWGKNFYRRFAAEVTEYYGKPLAEMEMVQFIECIKQCWKTYGWGIMDMDLTHYEQGFLVVKTSHSPFAEAAPKSTKPMCFAEAGLLSAFFSQLSGKELDCVQTGCESKGEEYNYFVLGIKDRVSKAQAWLEEGQDHQTIMERLCVSQGVESN